MTFLTHPEPEPDEERLREHEADFTPLPVARHCLRRASELRIQDFDSWYGRILDPCAGAGVWCQAARAEYDVSHVMAVEAREEEHQYLRAHADDIVIGDYLETDVRGRGFRFDLGVANPPFSRFFAFVEKMLDDCQEAAVFAPIDVKMRSEEGAKAWEKLSRYLDSVFVVPGPIYFRGPGENADFRTYALHVFNRCRVVNPEFHVLDWLPSHDRKWVTRPGTEVHS